MVPFFRKNYSKSSVQTRFYYSRMISHLLKKKNSFFDNFRINCCSTVNSEGFEVSKRSFLTQILQDCFDHLKFSLKTRRGKYGRKRLNICCQPLLGPDESCCPAKINFYVMIAN